MASLGLGDRVAHVERPYAGWIGHVASIVQHYDHAEYTVRWLDAQNQPTCLITNHLTLADLIPVGDHVIPHPGRMDIEHSLHYALKALAMAQMNEGGTDHDGDDGNSAA